MSELKYSVITTIKESSKGKVYLAKAEGYEFPVIIKQLKHGNKAVFQSLQTVDCDYVPKIYEVKENAEGLLIAEEYIEGELLADYIASAQFSEEIWLDIAKQLCEALRALHTHVPPVIHRDIKPSNIILNSQGRVKLIDFDSSRLFKEESDGDTRLLGTERYAPPEQYGFSQTDGRSDIYSLGVVLGMFPAFSSKTRKKHWQKMVEKCTLFAPESRYQTIDEIAKEVRKIQRVTAVNKRIVMVGSGIFLLFCLCVAGFFTNCFKQGEEQDVSAPMQEVVVPSANETKPELENTVPEVIEPDVIVSDKTETESVPEASVEDYRTVKPEWRDCETDSPAYVELKKDIRKHNSSVNYYFKDRMGEHAFLLHNKDLERKENQLLQMEIEVLETKNQYGIEEKYVEIREQLIWIDAEFMKSLEDGFYRLVSRVLHADGTVSEQGIFLYVSESDPLEEPVWWLQNTTLSFYGAEQETIHVAVQNDSSNEIVSLLYHDNTPVEPSLYRILYEGRVLEFSNELLCQYTRRDYGEFIVVGKDESKVAVQVQNCIPGILERE